MNQSTELCRNVQQRAGGSDRLRDAWDKKATIRNRAKRVLQHDPQQSYFPIYEQPLCSHPTVTSLGKDVQQRILTQTGYKFMLGISEHETRVVTTAVQKLICGLVPLPEDVKQALQTVVIDEVYHAMVANDFVQQVHALTGESPLPFPRNSDLGAALARSLERIPDEAQDAFSLVAVCIAENLITQELLVADPDPNVNSFFYEINQDHLADEGRHAKIFTEVAGLIWACFSTAVKQCILRELPSFVETWMKREVSLEGDRLILRALGLTESEVEKIIYDTFPDLDFKTAAEVIPNIRQIDKWLRRTGIWQHPEKLWEDPREGLSESPSVKFLERLIPLGTTPEPTSQRTELPSELSLDECAVIFLTYLCEVMQASTLEFTISDQSRDGGTSPRVFPVEADTRQAMAWFRRTARTWRSDSRGTDSFAATAPLVMSFDPTVKASSCPGVLTVHLASEGSLVVHYDRSHYDDGKIASLLTNFCHYAQAALRRPTAALSELPLTRTNPAAEYPDGCEIPPSTICDFLAEKARLAPDHVAIRKGKQRVTYQELEKTLSSLSAALRNAGLEQGSRVAIGVKDRFDFTRTLLGVMRAGLTAVPLSASEPPAYLSRILDEASVSLIICDREAFEVLTPLVESMPPTHSIKIWRCDDRLFFGADARHQDVLAEPEHPACILFTSGTTGKPKGINLLHNAIAEFATGTRESFPLGPDDVILQFSNLSFDASLAEIVNTVAAGATLAVPSEHIMDSPEQFFKECADLGVTVLNLPAAFWAQLIQETADVLELAPRIRVILVYGESLSLRALDTWYAKPRHATLINTYGPTEGTIGASFCHLDHQPTLRRGFQLLGRPFPGVSIHVLDQFQRPLPLGATGELCIGGLSVNASYLTGPEQAPRPVAQTHPELGPIYYTGDLGRWDTSVDAGTPLLIFHGRRDRQTKISGFRVELEQIEKTLEGHPDVTEALVLAQGQAGTAALVAFVLKKAGCDVSEFELNQVVEQSLARHSHPARIIVMDHWPLTPRGKVDKVALLMRLHQPVAPNHDTVALTDELKQIWQSLLVAPVGGDDSHFFKMGGSSLLAMTLVARVNERWRVGLTLRQVIETPTFGFLKSWLQQRLHHEDHASASDLRPVPSESGPLSYGQEAMLLIDRMRAGRSIEYNVAFTVTLNDDMGNPVDDGAMQLALNQLLQRHTALRTVFRWQGGQALQRVVPYTIELKREKVDFATFQELALADARSGFLLSETPPIRIRYFELTDCPRVVLYFNLHHIIHDGLSIHILTGELFSAYRQIKETGNPQALLPDLAGTYLSFASAIRRRADEERAAMLTFWGQYLRHAKPLTLPIRKRGRGDPLDGAAYSVVFPFEHLEPLRQRCMDEGVSLFAALLSGVLLSFREMADESDLTVGSIMSLRDDHADLGLVGMFVNAILLRVATHGSVRECIGRAHRSILEVVDYRHTPLAILINELNLPREPDEQKVYDVMVNYHPFANLFAPAGPVIDQVRFLDNQTSNSGLTVDLFDWGKELQIRFGYCGNLYDADDIAALGLSIAARLEELAHREWS